jgi:hypothetical protein
VFQKRRQFSMMMRASTSRRRMPSIIFDRDGRAIDAMLPWHRGVCWAAANPGASPESSGSSL